MPLVPLEPFVPWPESLRWQVHDAYFRGSGVDPWTTGEVPWRWTSCFPAARQLARFVLDYLGSIPEDRELHVLEIGCGNAVFAANFLRALRKERRPEARRRAARLVYHLTDQAPDVPRAAAEGFLAAEARAGRLVPGVFDARTATLRRLDGTADPTPFDVVIVNYVVCATPTHVWRHDGAGWAERHARVVVDDPEDRPASLLADAAMSGALDVAAMTVETQWAPASPAARHPGAVAAALGALHARLGPVTVAVPGPFLAAMEALDPGLLLVSDYGDDRDDGPRGNRACAPRDYGRSVAHGVDFALLDAWAAATGRLGARTRDGRAVAVAAYGRHAPVNFDRTFRHSDASRYLDLGHGAQLLDELGEPSRALTLIELALAYDPHDTELLLRMGECLVRLDRPAEGLRVLRRGRRLDDRPDFDLPIGRALARLGRHEAAVAALRTSCERFDTAEAATRLGNSYEALGLIDHARACYAHALERDPAFVVAKQFLDDLDAPDGVAPGPDPA